MIVIPTNIPHFPPAPAAPLGAPTYITPDCLLAYCSSRLQNIDTQMQTQFTTQQQGIQDSQMLQHIEQQLKDYFSNASKDSDGKLTAPMAIHDGYAAIQAEIATMHDSSAATTAQQALDDFCGLQTGATVDDAKSQAFDKLDSGQQALSQGQELGMIGLQSLMSQRQTAVQMTTNLVQSLGDQLKGVADNVGK